MEKVLVTGATGFLGRHTAERLVREGAQVTGIGRSLALGASLEKAGVRFAAADLSSSQGLAQIFKGHDYVIHCAALSSPWGRWQEFYDANVVATENVIAAARREGLKRMVHVSTPSLYIDKTDRLNISEDIALPPQGINFYAETKRVAEEKVDQAVKEGFPIVTIRPQGIIGPGDNAIIPRLVRLAKKQVMPVIGDGKNSVDLTYVDNVVESLILAMRAPAHVIGRKYNITNGDPVKLYDTLERIFKDLGYTYKKKQISFKTAYYLAQAMEFGARTFLRGREPMLTRYSVCALGLSRTLDIRAAQRDLGYRPIVDMPTAIRLVTENLVNENLQANA